MNGNGVNFALVWLLLPVSLGLTLETPAAHGARSAAPASSPSPQVRAVSRAHANARRTPLRAARRAFVFRPRARLRAAAPIPVRAPYFPAPAPYLPSYAAPVYVENAGPRYGGSYGNPYDHAITIEHTAASVASEPPTAPVAYYCLSSNAYYPDIRSCAEGWRQAAPDPAVSFLNVLRAR